MGQAGRQQHAPLPAKTRLAIHRRVRLDAAKLFALGYQQELKRGLSFINNTGCSVCLASCFLITDVYSLFRTTYGGPVTMMWCWIIATLGMLITSACVAELVSSFPTSGGLYYYAYVLGPPRWRAFLCWMTGWLNLIGQLTATVSFELTCVNFLSVIISIHTSGPDGGPGWQPTKPQLVGMYAAALAVHTTMCCISQKLTAGILSFGTFWHFISAPAFMMVLLAVVPERQDVTWVFTQWVDNAEKHGISSPMYVILMGLMIGHWTLVVFDSSAHLCEETIHGDSVACWAMVSGVGIAGALGIAMIASINACVQSFDSLLAAVPDFDGWVLAQLVCNIFKSRYGTALGALPLLYIAFVALFICPIASIISNSRMVYAFSRDGAMLGSKYLKCVHKPSGLPVYGTVFMAVLALPLGIISIYSHEAAYGFNCMVAMCMNLAFLIPLLLRLGHGTHGFIAGPFSLGRWSIPMTVVSCVWLTITTVIYCMPTSFPASHSAFRVSVSMLAACVAIITLSWWLRLFGKRVWFHGPAPNLAAPDDRHSPQMVPIINLPNSIVCEPLDVVQECNLLEELEDSDYEVDGIVRQAPRAVITTERTSMLVFPNITSSGRLSTVATKLVDPALAQGIEICAGRNALDRLLSVSNPDLPAPPPRSRSRNCSSVMYEAGTDYAAGNASSGAGSVGERSVDDKRRVTKPTLTGLIQTSNNGATVQQPRNRKASQCTDMSSSVDAGGSHAHSLVNVCMQANGSVLAPHQFSVGTGSNSEQTGPSQSERESRKLKTTLAAKVSAVVAHTTHGNVPFNLHLSSQSGLYDI